MMLPPEALTMRSRADCWSYETAPWLTSTPLAAALCVEPGKLLVANTIHCESGDQVG